MLPKRSLYLTEIASLLYVLITFIFVQINSHNLPNYNYHISLRIFIIGLLLLVYFLDKSIQTLIIKSIRIFLPLLFLPFFYNETDALNNIIFKSNLDPIIANFEFAIFNIQPSLEFSGIIPFNFFAEVMYYGYFSYYLLIVIIPLYLYFNDKREIAKRVLFVLIASFLSYYLFFIVFPVAGPQFHFKDSLSTLPGGYIFGYLVRTIQFYGEGQTAAFPSSHVSICLMLLFISLRYAKNLYKLTLIIFSLLVLSTIYIKAHYVVDVVAAFVFTPLLYILFDNLYKISTTNN